jgi:hypothetical protein
VRIVHVRMRRKFVAKCRLSGPKREDRFWPKPVCADCDRSRACGYVILPIVAQAA